MFLASRSPFFLILVSGLSLGCGSNEPFAYVQVAGKVTYEDGSLIEADYINVTFLPQTRPVDARTHPRASIAEVNIEDGTFKNVTTHKYGDGLTAGKHRVLVQAFDKNMIATRAIPARYADPESTPLQASTDEAPFHFKIAK